MALRASATANNGAGATTITVNLPSGTVSGDVMVAGIYVRRQGSATTVTPPAGWALIRRTDVNSPASSAGSLLSYYKVAGSAEPASYTWTFNTSRRALGGISSYTGVNTSAPIDVHGGRVNSPASTTVTAPSITTTVGNTMLVGLFCLFDNASFAPPTGMAEIWDFTVPNPNGTAYAAATETRSGTGATGTRAATSSVPGISIAQLISLKPAAATCTYAISPTGQPFASGGGTGSVAVTAPPGCSWTAASTLSWVTITAGGSGSGNGTVSYSVAANTATTSRTGTVTVAGQAFTVTQAGVCAYTISPTSQSFASGGGTGSVGVTSAAGCSWTAASTLSWVTITAGGSGSGNGTVSYSVAANTAPSSRTGTVTIAGQTFTVTQAGAVNYTLTASPSTVTAGGSLAISWTAPSGRPTTDWLGLYRVGDPNDRYLWQVYTYGAPSGSTTLSAPVQAGQYEFRYLLDNSFTDAARSSTVTVNPPVGYTLTASPSTVTAGGSLAISWTAPSGRPTTDWLGLYQLGDPNGNYLWWMYTNGATSGSYTLSAPVQAGQYEFRYLLDDGYTDAARSNTVTVTATCTYAISPTGQPFASGGGTGSVAVTAPPGCSWTAASTLSWVTITAGGSGSGNGTVSYSVAANTAPSSRTGTVTIAGQTFTLTQMASGSDPRSFAGAWDPNIIAWPNIPIHAHMLPNGKVLSWSNDVNGADPGPSYNRTDAYVWDVATGAFTSVPIPNSDSFCSGHTFLPDGRLLAAGGHIDNNVGINIAVIFDFRNNSWSAAPNMNAGRWYPTACALANGEALVVSGNIDNTHGVNQLPEVFTAAGDWRPLTNAMLSLPLYTWMHLAPNGKVFNSGPETITRYLDTSGAGAWTSVALTTKGSYRQYGTSVMYEPGKVLIIGGGDPPSNTAEVINLNAAPPAWRSVSSMAFARRLHSATLLPDGKVLVTGGTSSAGFNNGASAVLAAEMWDPQTESWSTLASMQVKRLYHSTAVLLPDGRVLSGGGGRPAADSDTSHLNAEIYSPPYLFQGARPTISSAPTSVSYGQTFSVQTPEAASITKVTWIRLPSVTHCNNMNQRINYLSFSQASGSLNVTAPADRNLCPPGHYMLFILNGNGVPSVARVIQIN